MTDEISLTGTAFKFTNFLFGYQKRFFKLKRGTIYYYLSKDAEKDGCRKFRSLKNFRLERDDELCRLDIIFPDDRWCLRFDSPEEQRLWHDALDAFLQPNQESKILSTEQRFSTTNDSTSNGDGTLSQLSGCQVKSTNYLTQPTYCAHSLRQAEPDLHRLTHMREHLPQQLEMVLRVLHRIVDTNAAPLDLALVEQTMDRCQQATEALKYLQTVLPTIQLQESMLSDDEWHDATSDGPFNDDDGRIYESLKATARPSPEPMTREEAPIFDEVRRISGQQLEHALASVEEGQWELFVKDGEMRMYKMEHEQDGVVSDPLKAVHFVEGVSAREFIDHFYDPDLKQEWDDTLVAAKLVDRLDENTVVLHQLHKRVWPAAQRESLFWSHFKDVSHRKEDGHRDAFFVCNHDCKREDVPLTDASCVRVGLTIAMLCQTRIAADKDHQRLTRKDVRCKIIYVAQVHPGGWVPASALRQVYKREYPKFLRQFSAYVLKKVKGRPLQL